MRLTEDKRALRKELILRRRGMDKSTREEYGRSIHNNLTELVKSRSPGRILCYISTDIEVDTTAFIQEMLSSGKEVFVPKCRDREMSFIRINSLSGLQKGAFGIPEPSGNEELRDFSGSLCVVPALSFDRGGYRLGYGGGYYDRFLEGYGGLSVGICYDCFIGGVPREEFDLPVQVLVTEREIIYCSGKGKE